MEARVYLHTASWGSSIYIGDINLRLKLCRDSPVRTAYYLCSPNAPTDPQPRAQTTNYTLHCRHDAYRRPHNYALRAGSEHLSGSRFPKAC